MIVKCFIELTFENDKDTVSYLDSHMLEKLLYDNGYDLNSIIMLPANEVKGKTFRETK